MKPNTRVLLLKVPFNSTYDDVLFATSDEDFYSQVITYPHIIFDKCTWQRDNMSFRADMNFNDIKQYNYCIYVNNDKRNYAFISQYIYVNDGMTLVDLQTDVWAEYIGQWEILPSSVIRQHPATDTMYTNVFPEQISVARWEVSRSDYALPGEDNDYMYLVTSNNANTFFNRASDFYSALAYFLAGDSAAISNFFSLVNVTPCTCETVTQGNTSYLSRSTAQNYLSAYARVGRQSDVLTAYHVPKKFTSAASEAVDYSSLPDFHIEHSIDLTYPVQPLWNKTRVLSQFNQIICTCCGNSRTYDFSLFKEAAITEEVKFDLSANQAATGNIRCTPLGYAGGNPGEFSCVSPTWDKVQLSTSAIDVSKSNEMIATAAVGGVGNLFSLNPAGILDDTMNLAKGEGELYKNSAINVGTPTSSIAAYAANNALVSLSHYKPSAADMDNINLYFCQYGYSYNGQVSEVFLDTMPICNYVKTNSANVRGDSIPDEDIKIICSIFNDGVKIWHGAENVRATDKILKNHF